MVVVRPGMVLVVLLLLPVGPEQVTEPGLLVVGGTRATIVLSNAAKGWYVLVTAPLR